MMDFFKAMREERAAERAAFLEAIRAMRDMVIATAETQKAFYAQFHTAEPAQGWTHTDLTEVEAEAEAIARRLDALDERDAVELPSLATLMGVKPMDS